MAFEPDKLTFLSEIAGMAKDVASDRGFAALNEQGRLVAVLLRDGDVVFRDHDNSETVILSANRSTAHALYRHAEAQARGSDPVDMVDAAALKKRGLSTILVACSMLAVGVVSATAYNVMTMADHERQMLVRQSFLSSPSENMDPELAAAINGNGEIDWAQAHLLDASQSNGENGSTR